jgi:hypothetical protein
MSQILIDGMLAEKLQNLIEPVQLVDQSGQVRGVYVPEVDPTRWEDLQPQISDEELARRMSKDGGRPLSAIWDDLEKRK